MATRDPVRALWYRLGRPGSLASFRLSYAAQRASKRKRSKKAPRRKTFGEGPFSRVAPAPSNFPEGLPARWGEWSRKRRGVDVEALDRKRVESIAARLEDIVPSHVVERMRGMELTRWYGIEIVVDQYHADQVDETEAPPGYAPSKRRIRMVGLGRKLWFKVGNIAESGEIEDVKIRDVSGPLTDAEMRRALTLKPNKQAWALFGSPRHKRQSVTLTDGSRFDGVGDFLAWEKERNARRKGRKRKRRGRHGYEQGRRISRADKAASKRYTKTQQRIEALRAAGKNREADRLERRAEAQRTAAQKTHDTVGKGIFARAKPRKRRGRKRKGKR